jgi:hypothetical protein
VLQGGGPLGDEEAFTVGQAPDEVGDFSYEYDFGDGWTHDVHVDQVIASVGSGTPHLVGGDRACPPEDCGGARGYEHLLEVLADPAPEEHDTYSAGSVARSIRRRLIPSRPTRTSSSTTGTPDNGGCAPGDPGTLAPVQLNLSKSGRWRRVRRPQQTHAE